MTTLLERLTGFKNSFQTGKNNIANVITGKGIEASGNNSLDDYVTKIRNLQIKNSNAPNFGLYNWAPSLTLPSKLVGGGVQTISDLAVLPAPDSWNWTVISITASILWGNPAATPNTRTMAYNFRSQAAYPANTSITALNQIIGSGGGLFPTIQRTRKQRSVGHNKRDRHYN
jgi:hypothetical protein